MDFVVEENVAKSEVDAWLESMDVNEEVKSSEAAKDAIGRIMKACQEGRLVFNGDEQVIQKLKTPLGDKGVTSEIKYDFRFTVGDYAKATKGVFDNTELAIAKLALIGNQHKGVFENMKRSDFVTASALVVFF